MKLQLFSTKRDSKMLELVEKIRKYFLASDQSMGIFIYTLKEKNLVNMNRTVE